MNAMWIGHVHGAARRPVVLEMLFEALPLSTVTNSAALLLLDVYPLRMA